MATAKKQLAATVAANARKLSQGPPTFSTSPNKPGEPVQQFLNMPFDRTNAVREDIFPPRPPRPRDPRPPRPRPPRPIIDVDPRRPQEPRPPRPPRPQEPRPPRPRPPRPQMDPTYTDIFPPRPFDPYQIDPSFPPRPFDPTYTDIFPPRPFDPYQIDPSFPPRPPRPYDPPYPVDPRDVPRPSDPYPEDPSRPQYPKEEDYGQYGFDPNLVNYLNEQRRMSATDAGVNYSYDPATQTFTGGTLGGPVTKTLEEMMADQEQSLFPRPGLPRDPGFGNGVPYPRPRDPGFGNGVPYPIPYPPQPQLPQKFQDALNAQERFKQQEMAMMRPYQQRVEAAMNNNPAYQQLMQLSRQLGPNANPQQLQQLQQLQARLSGDPAIREAQAQAQGASMEFNQQVGRPFQEEYGAQFQALQEYEQLQNRQPGQRVPENDPFFSSPEYRAFQDSTSGRAGTMDMYDSPYFGYVGSGSMGRAQDEAYRNYLRNNSQTGMPPMQQPYNPYQQPGGMPQFANPYTSRLTGLGQAASAAQTGMPQFARPCATGLGQAASAAHTGMPQFANPYAREFMGLGQAAANQMGLGQATGLTPGVGGMLSGSLRQQQRPQQRPQQRQMPGNYGGYNSIQGMGSNQYGGFNAPPPGMGGGQMGMGQMAQQQPQSQNNMFGSFGGFGQAMGGGQNQGPNQQAQQEDQYGNFGGGNNQGGGNQGGGGGGLF